MREEWSGPCELQDVPVSSRMTKVGGELWIFLLTPKTSGDLVLKSPGI